MSERYRLLLQGCRPIVVAVLGAGSPLSALKELGSLTLSFRPGELFGVLAKAAAVDLLSAVLAIGVTATLSGIAGMLRIAEAPRLFASAGTFAGRLLLAVFFLHAVLFWLRSLDLAGYVPVSSYWGLIAAPAFLLIVFVTARGSAKGRVFDNLRVLAGLSAGMAVIGLGLMSFHAAAVAVGTDQAPAVHQESLPQHIVLLSIDTLSAQHLSFEGAVRATTPNLARFAERARVFDRFYANGNWTTPGMTSLATGKRPWTTRTSVANEMPLASEVTDNVFKLAREAGYRTAAFVSNPNAVPSQLRLDTYVDHSRCMLSNRVNVIVASCLGEWFSVPAAAFNLTIAAQLLKHAPDELLASIRSGSSRAIFEPRQVFSPALQWLKTNRHTATFSWLHVMPPHDPHMGPAPFKGASDPSEAFTSMADALGLPGFAARGQQSILDAQSLRYDESILYVDQRLGEFLTALESEPQLKDALVIITADHGESFRHEFGMHGGIRLPEETIRIPLLIAGPGVTPARVKTIHEQVDLLPTLARLMKIPSGDQLHAEGRPLILGDVPEIPDEHAEAYAMSLEQTSSRGPLTRGAVALIRGRYKYVHYFGKPSYPNRLFAKSG